jgi:uncharacterized protein
MRAPGYGVALNSGMEGVEPAVCLSLLAGEEIGRLAVVVDGEPEICPLNYLVDDDGTIIFRTESGTTVSACVGSAAVFEVDSLDRATRSGWSVVVHGRLQVVPVSDSARFRGQRPWPRAEKLHFLRLCPTGMSGRRIGSRLP